MNIRTKSFIILLMAFLIVVISLVKAINNAYIISYHYLITFPLLLLLLILWKKGSKYFPLSLTVILIMGLFNIISFTVNNKSIEYKILINELSILSINIQLYPFILLTLFIILTFKEIYNAINKLISK